MWSEGGKRSRAHSPELIVARVLVVCVLIARVLVARVLIIAHVLVVTRILIIARVHSWALAVIREPQRPVWLVIRVCRGLWAIVRGRWAVVAAYGQ